MGEGVALNPPRGHLAAGWLCCGRALFWFLLGFAGFRAVLKSWLCLWPVSDQLKPCFMLFKDGVLSKHGFSLSSGHGHRDLVLVLHA